MIEPRLASHLQVKAMQHIAAQQGNFLTIISKGDLTSGAIILLHRIRGEKPSVLERFPHIDGSVKWTPSGPKTIEKEEDINHWIGKRSNNDPDLWVVELDTADDTQLNEILDGLG